MKMEDLEIAEFEGGCLAAQAEEGGTRDPYKHAVNVVVDSPCDLGLSVTLGPNGVRELYAWLGKWIERDDAGTHAY